MNIIFLDRDGVINEAIVHEGRPYSPLSLAEVNILPGVKEAIDILKLHSFELIIVSNQPEVSRGNLKIEELDAINRRIELETGIKNIYVCIHSDLDNCDCRKPKTGLFEKAIIDLRLGSEKMFMIGDRAKDIEAGLSFGCDTYFIDNGYSEERPLGLYKKIDSLLDFALLITNQNSI